VSAATTPPATVIAAFGLEPESVTPLAGGLINASFRARRAGGEAVVLQRVNPIFPAVVNDDIDAVTRHLGARGLSTPQLLRTQTGHTCLVAADGVWRLLSYIAGATHQALADASQAHEAGRVLGGFHAALADFDTPLGNRRPPVHELARHLGHLQQTLKRQTGHRQHAAVTALATEIFALADAIGPLPAMPDRLVHGDPKISNIIFAGDRAVCLVDLDTIGRFPAPLELGDALRSWCVSVRRATFSSRRALLLLRPPFRWRERASLPSRNASRSRRACRLPESPADGSGGEMRRFRAGQPERRRRQDDDGG
jgi:Ser/Thr protein kinase RdoA (MazF antagonist)